MGVAAGKLRHRVTIQDRVTVVNTFGEQDTSWQDVADVWAAIEPLSAKEFVEAQQTQSKVTARITIRYLDGLKPEMRIVHRTTHYNIEGVIPDPVSGIEHITLPVSTGTNEG